MIELEKMMDPDYLGIVSFKCPKCKATFPVNKNQYRRTNKGLMVLCQCPQCHRFIKSYREEK